MADDAPPSLLPDRKDASAPPRRPRRRPPMDRIDVSGLRTATRPRTRRRPHPHRPRRPHRPTSKARAGWLGSWLCQMPAGSVSNGYCRSRSRSFGPSGSISSPRAAGNLRINRLARRKLTTGYPSNGGAGARTQGRQHSPPPPRSFMSETAPARRHADLAGRGTQSVRRRPFRRRFYEPTRFRSGPASTCAPRLVAGAS
jgi:hypothetical protein